MSFDRMSSNIVDRTLYGIVGCMNSLKGYKIVFPPEESSLFPSEVQNHSSKELPDECFCIRNVTYTGPQEHFPLRKSNIFQLEVRTLLISISMEFRDGYSHYLFQ